MTFDATFSRMPLSRSAGARTGAILGILGGGLATMSWAGHAGAYCREVTASPPAGYDPAQQGCYAGPGSLPPLFWRNQCVGYSLQRNASKQISLADATSVAERAFTTWSSAACPGGGTPSILPTAFPPVTCNAVPSEAHNNPIIFRDDGWPYADTSNAIGYTTLTVYLSTGEILGATVEINSANYTIVANPPAPQGAYDLASILTHEAGHFLGLAHAADSTAVMNAFYKPGSTVLSPDDVAGICSIYSPDGSRSTQNGPASAMTCDSTPPNGFTDDCGSLDAGGSAVGAGGGNAGTAGDGGDPPAPCAYSVLSCAVGHAAGSRDGRLAPFGVVVLLGAIAARARRASRRAGAAGALGLFLGVLGAGATCARAAKASVSVSVLFDELLRKAAAAAVVTPTDQRALWEGGRIVTYTRVRVDRPVAGHLAGEVWVRTMGGAVGNIGQIVEGEATFQAGQPSLVFLHTHLEAATDPSTGADGGTLGVVEGAQGQFPIATPVADARSGGPRLAIAQNMGALLAPPFRATPARLARDVLQGRPVEDAVREIRAAWPRTHAR
jgi:hypothetical protein